MLKKRPINLTPLFITDRRTFTVYRKKTENASFMEE